MLTDPKNKIAQAKQVLTTKEKVHLIIPKFPQKFLIDKAQLKLSVSQIISTLQILM